MIKDETEKSIPTYAFNRLIAKEGGIKNGPIFLSWKKYFHWKNKKIRQYHPTTDLDNNKNNSVFSLNAAK